MRLMTYILLTVATALTPAVVQSSELAAVPPPGTSPLLHEIARANHWGFEPSPVGREPSRPGRPSRQAIADDIAAELLADVQTRRGPTMPGSVVLLMRSWGRHVAETPTGEVPEQLHAIASTAMRESEGDPLVAALEAQAGAMVTAPGAAERLAAVIHGTVPVGDSAFAQHVATAGALTIWSEYVQQPIVPAVTSLQRFGRIGELVEIGAIGNDIRLRTVALLAKTAVRNGLPVAGKVAIAQAHGRGRLHPWLGSLIEGYLAVELAWKALGDGPIANVTAPGWKDFVAKMQFAEQVLRHAHDLRPDLPDAAALLITVANYLDHGEAAEWRWFERAVATDVDDPEAYATLFNSWRKTQGGGTELLLAGGDAALASGRYDTWAPYQFFEMLRRLQRDFRADPEKGSPDRRAQLWRDPRIWPRLETMFAGYAASGLVPTDDPWMLTAHATCAWRCGRLDDARRVLALVGDRFAGKHAALVFDLPGVDIARDIASATPAP